MTNEIPTADHLPLLGSALEFGRDPFGFLEDAPKKYGPVFRISIPGLSAICYTDPALAKQSLVERAQKYEKDDRELTQLGELLGDGLLTSRGETWERGREHVQPALYPGQLTRYATEMVDQTRGTIDGWSDGDRLDIYEEATQLTLSIIASTLLGVGRITETEVIADAADAITQRFEPSTIPIEVPLWVPTPTNRRYRRATDELDAVIDELLSRRTASDDSNPDLCSRLIAARESGALTDSEIRDHLVTMLFAGHETTAIALTYTVGLLATHPEIQQQVIQEVRAPDRITPQTDLPLTNRVIQESLRLYPPTYALFRQTTAEDTAAGYRIPAGERVVISQWSIHRSSQYYTDPLEFRPDRWQPERADGRHEFAYFPFGGGERQCIGRRFALLELRLTLATMLRSVRFESVPETELSPTPALTSRPEGPVWVEVET